jgi:hypothetical protein
VTGIPIDGGAAILGEARALLRTRIPELVTIKKTSARTTVIECDGPESNNLFNLSSAATPRYIYPNETVYIQMEKTSSEAKSANRLW